MVPDRVREPHDIEPAEGHAFAVVWRRQEIFDQSGAGFGRLVFLEGGDFFGLRRQTDEIEEEPARERVSVRLWRRLQANLLQALLNEKINAVSTCGHGWLDRRHVSPVLLVLCALSNPLSKQLLLLRRECLMRLGRGHEIIRVSGKNALDQFALVRFSRDNRQLGNRLFAHVEAELAFALVLVRPMAKETLVGENRPDIPIVRGWMIWCPGICRRCRGMGWRVGRELAMWPMRSGRESTASERTGRISRL